MTEEERIMARADAAVERMARRLAANRDTADSFAAQACELKRMMERIDGLERDLRAVIEERRKRDLMSEKARAVLRALGVKVPA